MSASRKSRESLVDVARAVADFEKSGAVFDQSARVLVLRNFTAEGLEPFVKRALYASGIEPRIRFGDHDVIHQVALDPASLLARDEFDITVLAMLLEGLAPDYRERSWSWEVTWKDLKAMLDDFADRTHGLIAVNSFLTLFPQEGAASSGIAELNRALQGYVDGRRDRFALIDCSRFVALLGERDSIDRRYWYQARAPFRPAFLRLWGEEVARLASELKGRAKKCLVVDCDNTLWGGVVGEDGPEGIQLDPHEYPGKVFYDFQVAVRNCVEAGVVLALCSKNNERDALEVIDHHPHCLIRREHIAAWRVNWRDKASNLEELAAELNLGLDSFVFVDDQPLECELVSRALPQVQVLAVPEVLTELPDLLSRHGLFQNGPVSAEDCSRGQLYREESQRTAARERHVDLEGFLRSLDLRARIGPVEAGDIPRVAQLTQKTNQFNLTTRRYSEGEIRRLVEDPDAAVFAMRVRDRYGDAGLTGVLIARRREDLAEIDSLLLSCRVLGRSLEDAFVEECLARLRDAWCPREWRARYLPSKKNAQVAEFWDRAGFVRAETLGESGSSNYSAAVDERSAREIDWIAVERTYGNAEEE